MFILFIFFSNIFLVNNPRKSERSGTSSCLAPLWFPAGRHMTEQGEPPDSCSSSSCSLPVTPLVPCRLPSLSARRKTPSWRTQQPGSLRRNTPTSMRWRTGRTCSWSRAPLWRRWGGGDGKEGGRMEAGAGRQGVMPPAAENNNLEEQKSPIKP